MRNRVALLWVALAFAGVVGCVLHLFGAAFYEQSPWYYVPPLSALSLFLCLKARPRLLAFALCYLLVTVFILSYFVKNWEIALGRFGPEGLYYFPDVAEAVLVLVLVIAMHRKAQGGGGS